MKELLTLAEEKGFKPKTFSTNWTFENLLGRGKMREGSLVNSQCESNLLNEIQKWLREIHKIYMLIDMGIQRDYHWKCFDEESPFNYSEGSFETYEQALESGLYEALKLI